MKYIYIDRETGNHLSGCEVYRKRLDTTMVAVKSIGRDSIPRGLL